MKRIEILRLAVPSILANITVPLVGMADIAVAGHLGTASGSAAALIGGITIGTMLFDLLYWNFAFLRTGTGGLTAQAYGSFLAAPDKAPHEAEIRGILFRALRIACISGLVLIAMQWAVLWLAFLFVDCSPEVRTLATQYFQIRIWAAPATLSLFAIKGWFIGLQDTVRPMIADLIVNGLNIALSFGLGFGLCGLPPLGFAGVATGTVIAQWSGLAYAALMTRKAAAFAGPSAHCTPTGSAVEGPSAHVANGNLSARHRQSSGGDHSFFSLNRDLLIRSFGMIAIYIGFTVISARYGDTLLAVSAILMKLLMVFSYFTDGFAYAGEALTGKFIGARDRAGVLATVRGTFLWGCGVTALFMLVYGLGGGTLLQLMRSDPAVISAGRLYLPWLLLMPLIGVPAFIWDGILTGATDTRALRSSVLWSAAGFFGLFLAGDALLHALASSSYINPSVGTDTINNLCGAVAGLSYNEAGTTIAINAATGIPQSSINAIHLLLAAYFLHLAIRSIYLTVHSRKLLSRPL